MNRLELTLTEIGPDGARKEIARTLVPKDAEAKVLRIAVMFERESEQANGRN